MNSLLKMTLLALLITGLGLGFGGAKAVTIEDSAGNPDAVAPLADPDEAVNTQSGGFLAITPDQNDSGDTLQWTSGNLTMPSGTSDGQTQ